METMMLKSQKGSQRKSNMIALRSTLSRLASFDAAKLLDEKEEIQELLNRMGNDPKAMAILQKMFKDAADKK